MSRSISQLLSNYGMGIVLLLLCAYYSYATIRIRQLSGADAVDDVARQITAAKPNPLILLVAGLSADDREFTSLISKKLAISKTANDPPSTRAMIQEAIASGRAPDFIIVTEDSNKWLPRVLERIPAAKDAAVIVPRSYKWPDFLQKTNLINIANQIVVIAVIAVGMTMVIITGGIDLSVGSLLALSAVITGIFIKNHGGNSASTGVLICSSLAAIVAVGLVGAFSGAMIT